MDINAWAYNILLCIMVVHDDSMHIGYSVHLGGTHDGQLCMDR